MLRQRATMFALLAALLMASSAFAQMEADRPVAPGIDPPKTAVNRLASAGSAEEFPDADYMIVFEDQVSKVVESGVTYVDLYTLYKVLNEAGTVSMSALRWDYDPQSSFVKVVEVNIIRGGKRIKVSLDGLLDQPAPQSAIYWSNRIKMLQLPRLQVGDGIEVRIMRKGYNYALLKAESGFSGTPAVDAIAAQGDDRYIPPMAGEYFDIVLFQADVPIAEKRYTLVLPSSKRLISEVYNGPLYSKTSYTPDSTMYTWWRLDVPAMVHELRQPDASDFVTKVVMSTAESWEAKSRWFYDVNKNQFEVTDAIREKVQSILAAAGVQNGSDMEKAKALNHWVAQNIRYSGQTMGDGEGFTLHPSDLLFEYRSGVCKDIASMSVTFLRAAGLDSYPAMTLAGGRIENLPADQFNHCVVALRQKDRFVMIDPTWVPFNNDIWSKLETEQQYVIGTPEGVKLNEIRYSPPNESPIKITHDAELLEDGTLEGKIRIDGKGAGDSRLRRFVYQRPRRDIITYLEETLSAMSNRVEVTAYDHRVVDDFSGDMWFTINYKIPQYAVVMGDAMEFHPPAVRAAMKHSLLFRAGSVDWEEERETDVFLYYTQQLNVQETIRLPKGYKLVDNINVEKIDEPYAGFSAEVSLKRRNLTLSTIAEVRRRQIPPDRYPEFYKAVKALESWGNRIIRVSKGGA